MTTARDEAIRVCMHVLKYYCNDESREPSREASREPPITPDIFVNVTKLIRWFREMPRDLRRKLESDDALMCSCIGFGNEFFACDSHETA